MNSTNRLRKAPPSPSPAQNTRSSSATTLEANRDVVRVKPTFNHASSTPTPQALNSVSGDRDSSSYVNTHSSSNGRTNETSASVQPLTAAEQYWAARALKAEALLSAQEAHHKELRSVAYNQEMKRNYEISKLTKEHKEKHAGLERLVMILITTLLCLVGVLIYLATHYTRHQTAMQRSRWSLPSHFTIPILSPFTSVVEKETSVLGTKVISLMVLSSAGLAYLAFRHWLARSMNLGAVRQSTNR
ncbi:hypothetical protein BDQ12DRAFT_133888 [Crucibulum laeve]|uniref:Uncharacterized protein n=1 Tax=Crucibulum laeve TaxID=68775 RepID=A0A5C3M1I6_9AGAR|nr:hypothetical protein BDQ12DRAFT_133888 [Crucibulum laeve]